VYRPIAKAGNKNAAAVNAPKSAVPAKSKSFHRFFLPALVHNPVRAGSCHQEARKRH
jgi:hypothetical protein